MAASGRAAALRRWGFLEDWLQLLQKHLSYVEHQELDSGTLQSGLKSLCVYLPWPPKKTTGYHRKLCKLREAMELVGWMLELDKNAWHLLHDADLLCLEEFDASDYDPCDLRPHFLIKAYSSRDPGGDTVDSIAACATLLTEIEGYSTSGGYERARAKVFRELGARGRLEGFQLPISIVIGPDPLPDDQVPVYMKQAKALVRSIHEQSQEHGSGYPFRLTQVIFRPWELTIRDEASGDDVQSFVECVLSLGIELVELAVKLEDPEPQALGRLLLSSTRRIQRNRRTGTADALMVTKNSLPAFASVCSALTASSTLRRLQLYEAFDDPEPRSRFADENRMTRWKWLGFALCSRASRSSIQELFVDDDRLLLRDIMALTQVVESTEPIHAVCSSSPDQACGTDRAVRLGADAMLRLVSINGDDFSLQSLAIADTEWFSIITEDTGSEWMEILVPGYGRAFVECESVTHVSTTKLVTNAPLPRLTCLHLAFNQCQQGVLPMMMSTIGHSLVSLDIDAKDIRLVLAVDVSAIVESCPLLKMLSLNRAKIGSLELFTQAYEEQRCKISTLSLCNVQASNASLSAFAMVLEDPAHLMTKTLREFRYIYGDIDEMPRPDAHGAKAFLRMIRVNRTLSFFELGLEHELHKKYSPKFREIDSTVLVSHSSDLSLELKLAFLACIDVSGNGNTKRRRQAPGESNRPRLSRALVANVFQFARKRIFRVVSATT